ncbi:MAG: prenyltransferase [Lentilactobacillus diolivorans]|jgi:1,4-dihydroxy-2-naphthoate octaprenyltransferase|uniref:1,4-dihydroxy-2-naphthoate octaprenyltransferase n=2 Tax=Lentilactobacillus diolivorans TaxID=179838 RepID=A0A0R1SJ85_9LACO|nr:prenyltransferase [Lentilactobacillus diolivorans]KRL64891.1 1,4-dihydroxy-2-naphthoate octaprenyltransferase [Lentilactobacillus diolivorans DSM 14421]MCH4165406.1 prenyltransferase [Lentilactobacillus diolivorans]MDH5106143.1 prenyltransferase [Lentilactobacillus diolivorans]GEP23906.1 1,4-dihydroxy-2-naphthoate octaprenyltransferase [Lentilactobacillus diolivorans]
MSLSTFLELVEFKAKSASVFPFIVGLFFSWYFLNSTNPIYAILFFIAMFLFNMFVDIWDNYNDYQHSDQEDFKKGTNVIGRKHISLNLLRTIMSLMFIPSALIGIYLTYEVGLPLLWMGLFCFLIGLLYAAGPLPISNTPFGELASGFTMGVMIVVISVYINSYQIFTWTPHLLWHIFLAASPEFVWIGNIMFANNICDAQEDEKNHRHTIVHYLGVKHSVLLWNIANILAILLVFLAIYINVYPITLISILLPLPFIIKQMKLFTHEQIKVKTFVCSVKILISGSLGLCLGFLIYWIYSFFA